MEIVIFGVGAMGLFFAGRLTRLAAKSDRFNVTVVGTWVEQVRALRENELTLIEQTGRREHVAINVTSNLSEVSPADVALILLKSYQTQRVAKQLHHVLKNNGVAVTLQNGLGNVEQLVEAVGIHRTVLGVTTQAAKLHGVGCVEHTGSGTTYLASESSFPGEAAQPATLLNLADIQTEVVENGAGLLWSKLAINVAINPLTALLEVRNGELLNHDPYRRMMMMAAAEVAELAAAQSITLAFDDPIRKAFEVCQATANNQSSMLQDILNSRPTEIDAMCGEIVAMGQRLDMATPVNEFFLEKVKQKEAGHGIHPQTIIDCALHASRLESRRYSEISLG